MTAPELIAIVQSWQLAHPYRSPPWCYYEGVLDALTAQKRGELPAVGITKIKADDFSKER